MREGWESKNLQECIERIKYPNKVPRKSFLDSGPFPIISQEKEFINGYWFNEADLLRIKKPIVIFGDHTQALKYIDFDFVLGADGVKVLQPKDFIDPKYFFYFLNAHPLKKLGYARHYRILKELTVYYPKSLSDQKRIVVILDEAFEGIGRAAANAEKNLASSRELFDSTLQAIFRRGVEWERITLSELIERGWITSHLDGNHGSNYPRKSEFIDHGVPYISANCLRDEAVDFSLVKYLSPERAASLRKGIAQNQDVLFAHNATVGPVALLNTDLDKVILSTSLTYYRCNKTHIVPEYLAHYMRSWNFRKQYELVMRQSTRNQVPITKQREFFHIIPPVEEQNIIAGHLDELSNEVSRLQAIYQKELDGLAELKQSILQKAFSGALTAQPDQALKEAVA